MIGMVLAAGAGRRLRPYTDTLPKALIPVAEDTAILDISLHNLAAVGLTDVVVVVGYAADAVTQRVAQLEDRHGVQLDVGLQRQGRDLEQRLLDVGGARGHGGRCIDGQRRYRASAVGRRGSAGRARTGHPARCRPGETLGEEEMKVLLDADGNLAKITKLMDPASAHGEYIGVSLIEPSALPALTARCKRPSNATRICTTRTATRRSSIAAAGSVPRPSR